MKECGHSNISIIIIRSSSSLSELILDSSDCGLVGKLLRDLVDELGVFDHLVSQVFGDLLPDTVLEFVAFLAGEVLRDLNTIGSEGGHEGGGLLCDLLVVVSEIGAHVLVAASAVLVFFAGLLFVIALRPAIFATS